MIKSSALINEGDGWINSETLISDSGVHTKYTTTESLFGHSLFGYNLTMNRGALTWVESFWSYNAKVIDY